MFCSKSREEMIREHILQSEMRVASQMGMPTTRLLGTALLNGTQSLRGNLNHSLLSTSPSKLGSRGDNFSGMNLLGSLGFTSSVAQDRLNNTFSPDDSVAEDDIHSHHTCNN